jgi:glycosyltransferase involved in cell wall biosynthesis
VNSLSPLVTIVTPSYNKRPYIEETILSIRNQTYPHIEHIVMDGGSTDGTLDLLHRYEDRLTWVSEPDRGQSDAINKGWKMAKGGILGSINADDTYLPWAVETAVNFLDRNPDIAMVYGKCDFIDEEGHKLGEFPSRDFDLASYVRGPNMIPTPTVFFRADILREVGYLDTSLHLSMDYDFHIRIGLRHRILYIPKLLATYRLCAGSKTTAQFSGFGPDCLYIMNNLYSRTDLPETVLKVKSQAYGKAHWQMGLSHWSHGDMRQARAHFVKTLRLDPKRILNSPFNALYLGVSLLGTPWGNRLLQVKHRICKPPLSVPPNSPHQA